MAEWVCSNILPPGCNMVSGLFLAYRPCSWLEGRSLYLTFWISEWEQYCGCAWLFVVWYSCFFIQGLWKVRPVQFCVYGGDLYLHFLPFGQPTVLHGHLWIWRWGLNHAGWSQGLAFAACPRLCCWRVKTGITPIRFKGSSVFLGASPFTFALTSPADPSGMVRRGWSLLPLHFWAQAWDQELQDCRRCLGSFRGRKKEGSGEAFRAVPEGSYASKSKQECSCCYLDHSSPWGSRYQMWSLQAGSGIHCSKTAAVKIFLLQRITLL